MIQSLDQADNVAVVVAGTLQATGVLADRAVRHIEKLTVLARVLARRPASAPVGRCRHAAQQSATGQPAW